MSPRSRPALVLALGTCLLAGVPLGAHIVPVEQVVEGTVQPQGGRLLVRLHVPATALVDARLPRLDDGTLDPAAIARPLQIVAADAARNLDVQQDDVPLGSPAVEARLGADRTSIDIELTYAVNSRSTRFSARLNAFQGAPLRPVRTTIRYVPATGRAQIVSVAGPPSRVRFDPDPVETLQEIVPRALGSVLAVGDHLLLLVLLILPARRASDVARLVGAMLAGQAASLTLSAVAPASAWWLAPAAATIAASAVVVAGLQNIVRARLRWVAVLAVVFGLLNGLAFGDGFAGGRDLAGSHQALALAAFLLVVMAGQLWLGAVMWAVRTWLDARGAPDRLLTVLVSVLVAHTAAHRAVDRGQVLAGSGSLSVEQVMVWLTLGWALATSIVAGVEWMRSRRLPVAALDRTPGRAQA